MAGVSRTPGDDLKLVAGLAPIAGTGSAQNGAWVDRLGFFAAIIPFAYTTSGGVTGGTITIKLQDATSSAGAGSADFSTSTSIAIGAGPNETGINEFARSLNGARRYIRAVITSSPTGGTPASIVAAPLLLTCADKAPV